ncbi:MAG: HAMP domain-containing histidine kinase [Conexibacteraceae bacterium]|nr:HAMP domain-containing histidine kinase [Conexibacteraceae bacterium]
MASLVSFIRSAARVTFSAYRRVPVRWRLGGGSAALTFVILAGVAGVTDVLTDHHISQAFAQSQGGAISQLSGELKPTVSGTTFSCQPAIYTFGEPDSAQIRLFARDGTLMCSNTGTVNDPPFSRPPGTHHEIWPQTYYENGYRVDWQPIEVAGAHRTGLLLYALPLSNLEQTISEVRLILIGGVLGGAILALLAGLLVAQRAMRPVVELTDAAREIERTRDPSLRIPHPEAEDEVADLARTLESMLGALDAARNESEAALVRQREFVADASHELRTPLTSVLANLELLAEELDGEQADSAQSALRSTRRMRRLVADLLLLARADVGRLQPLRPTDLAECLTDAASELGPSLDHHEVTIDAEPAPVAGLSDDLHRLILNLLENAISHTPPGTHITASTGMHDGRPALVVEDDGPGIAPALQRRVFERFVRGGGDAGPRGTGLGLAIVEAVASSHRAEVKLTSLPQMQGTRFEVVFPQARTGAPRPEGTGVRANPPAPVSAEAASQTSTTTGRTIGRRRSRS